MEQSGWIGAGRFDRPAADGKGMRRMFRKSVSIMVLASFLSLIVYSCAGEQTAQPGASRGETHGLAWLDDQLSRAPEVRELLEIRDNIISRALDKSITSQQVREVANDPQRSNELLGLSKSDAKRIQDRMECLIGSLCSRFPMLEELVAERALAYESNACDTDCLTTSWDVYSRAFAAAQLNDLVSDSGATPAAGREGESGGSLSPARTPLICKWSQLMVGFALCGVKSAGSLLFYAICSYGVFCGSCDGGVADMICR